MALLYRCFTFEQATPRTTTPAPPSGMRGGRWRAAAPRRARLSLISSWVLRKFNRTLPHQARPFWETLCRWIRCGEQRSAALCCGFSGVGKVLKLNVCMRSCR